MDFFLFIGFHLLNSIKYKKILLTISFNLIIKAVYCSDWNYQGLGPDVWIHEYPSCAGNLQSPINIDTKKATFDLKLSHFHFFNYDKILFWNITNNGHTSIFIHNHFNVSINFC